jgi:hypothetical protein
VSRLGVGGATSTRSASQTRLVGEEDLEEEEKGVGAGVADPDNAPDLLADAATPCHTTPTSPRADQAEFRNVTMLKQSSV